MVINLRLTVGWIQYLLVRENPATVLFIAGYPLYVNSSKIRNYVPFFFGNNAGC